MHLWHSAALSGVWRRSKRLQKERLADIIGMFGVSSSSGLDDQTSADTGMYRSSWILEDVLALPEVDKIPSSLRLSDRLVLTVIDDFLLTARTNEMTSTSESYKRRRNKQFVHISKLFDLDSKTNNPMQRVRQSLIQLQDEFLDALQFKGANSGGRGGGIASSALEKAWSGPKAIEQLYCYLEGKQEQPFMRHAAPFIEDHSRSLMKEQVQSLIERNGRPAPLICVHGQEMRHGLEAIAASIPKWQALGDDRQILVLPLVPVGDVRDPKRFSHALTFDEILGKLSAFAAHGIDAVEEAKPVNANENIFQVIEEIRRNLAHTPRIIVFHGYEEFESRFQPTLAAHCRDDYIRSLVIRLLEPPVGRRLEDTAFLDFDRFAENQIIITTNRALDWSLMAEIKPGWPTEPICVPVPLPVARWEEILACQGLNNPSSTIDVVRSFLQKYRPQSDLHYLVDWICSEISQTHPVPKSWAGWDPLRIQDVTNPNKVLISNICSYLEYSNPKLLAVMLVVSLVPDGLRRTTLLSIVSRLQAVALEDCICLGFRALKCLTENDLTLALGRARNIIGEYRPDQVAGLDPQENAPVAIAFLSSQIRKAVQEWFCDRLIFRGDQSQQQYFHLIQRLLFDQCLVQLDDAIQMSARFGGDSIRPWRRVLSAVYHGVQSIPVDFGEDYRGSVNVLQYRTAFATALRADFGCSDFDGRSLWKFIYHVLIVQLLEAPPSWNLTRTFALDELKLALLSACDKPWLLWGVSAEHVFLNGSMVESIWEDGDVQRDQYDASILHALWMSNKLDLALTRMGTQGLRGVTSDTSCKRQPISFAVFKRQLDILLLANDYRDPGNNILDIQYWPDQISELATDIQLEKIWSRLFNLSQQLTKRLLLHCEARRLPTLAELETSMAPEIDEALGEAGPPLIARLEVVIDALLRAGELNANLADLALKQATSGNLNQNDRVFGFLRALGFFLVADFAWRRQQRANPSIGSKFANGHGSRVAIRVALKLRTLLTLPDRAVALSQFETNEDLLLIFALRLSNHLAMCLLRFPRERANLLILRATILRLTGRTSEWRQALHYLAEADSIVLSLGQTARERMRVALERLKWHKKLKSIQPGHLELAGTWVDDLINYDLSVLRCRSQDPASIPLWFAISQRMEHSIDDA